MRLGIPISRPGQCHACRVIIIFDRVEIRRFRGTGRNSISTAWADVNVLLGANDVGKTSVLEALFLLTGFANPTVPVRIQQWRRLPIDRFEYFEALFHQIDPDQPIELVAHSDGAIVRRTLRISAPYTELEVDPEAPASAGGGDGRSRTSAKAAGPAGGQSSSSLLSARRRLLRYDVTLQPRDGDTASYSATLRRREDGFQVKQSAEPADEATISARYMTPAVDYDGAAIGDLIVRKEVGRLVQFLKEVNPRIRDVAASGDLVYLDIGLDRMVPLNLFGSGMVRAASILSHCMLANERLLFLDELENGLHHAAVRPLLEALLVLSREQDMQVFVTTHSVAVLRSLLDVLGCDGFASHRSTTHCYTLKRDREGRVRPYRYEHAQFEHCVRHGIEIR